MKEDLSFATEEHLHFTVVHKEKITPQDVPNFLPAGVEYENRSSNPSDPHTVGVVFEYNPLKVISLTHMTIDPKGADTINFFIAQHLELIEPTILGLELVFYSGTVREFSRWIYLDAFKEDWLYLYLSKLNQEAKSKLRSIVDEEELNVDWF